MPDRVRSAEVQERLNEIADPCGSAAGIEIGIVDMGIVESASVSGTHVSVTLRPTFPGCMFLGIFEDEIVRKLTQLPWCLEVSVLLSGADRIWDETMMTPNGKSTLMMARTSPAVPVRGSCKRH